MVQSINTILKEKRKNKRESIQNRINELVAWLSENNVSDASWDVKVRELNANELQLEMMDQQVKNANCVEYSVSLMVGVPIC